MRHRYTGLTVWVGSVEPSVSETYFQGASKRKVWSQEKSVAMKGRKQPGGLEAQQAELCPLLMRGCPLLVQVQVMP